MKAATDDCIFAMDDLEISIHAAREGGDGLSGYFALLCLEFQSTPPVKAATQPVALTELPKAFQSTPPVKAATTAVCVDESCMRISIHAAREGGDGYIWKDAP